MHEAFTFDTRLGVYVLRDDFDLSQLNETERKQVWGQWILICANMTDRVAELEKQMMEKLEAMYTVKTEEEMHELNTEMMELASIVCDLNILSRSVYEDLAKVHF
jgi:hypothetical protein